MAVAYDCGLALLGTASHRPPIAKYCPRPQIGIKSF